MEDEQSDDNISELNNDPPEEGEDDEVSFESHSSRGRGRPRIPESWTRVISFNHDDLNAQFFFPIGPDLLMA